MTLQEQFDDAQGRVKKLSKTPSNDALLELYGLYKQATSGDVQGKRPGMFDLKGRAKFDAWTSRKGMTRDQAMESYVKVVDRLVAADRA
ncbi:MAG: acyl-CoA-binding protein [Deltaproteobacteria bacterium]|nr:acyl-CoA-binding protein [Deltaproteobacteria bacterium]